MTAFIPALSLAILLPASLFAQEVAVSGGMGFPVYVADIPPYETSYVPVFLYGTPSTGEGSQTLTLDQGWRLSYWGALEWLPSAHAGLLVRGTFRHTPLEGANAPYEISVDYTALQPPDYVPRQYHHERSTTWPDTTGHLDRSEFDVQATVASTAASGLRAHVDGGLVLVGTSGTFEPIGMTSFQLGGHSVLFTNEYQLVMDLPRTWAVAGVVSGGLTVPIASHVGVDLSVRFVLPRTVRADVHVTELVGDTAIAELTAAEAESILEPEPVSLKLGTFEVVVGLRVRL